MTDLEQKRALKKEWDIVKKKEERFFAEQKEKKDSALNRMLEEKVPEKLQATLDAAFSKAFTLVFHRGTAVIEKTYRKEVMKEAGESYGLSEVGEQGYSIAAKTGTAERGDGTNNAWLVTFAPADDPQYIIVANRLKTTEIGKTLAPVVEDLYDSLFDHE